MCTRRHNYYSMQHGHKREVPDRPTDHGCSARHSFDRALIIVVYKKKESWARTELASSCTRMGVGPSRAPPTRRCKSAVTRALSCGDLKKAPVRPCTRRWSALLSTRMESFPISSISDRGYHGTNADASACSTARLTSGSVLTTAGEPHRCDVNTLPYLQGKKAGLIIVQYSCRVKIIVIGREQIKLTGGCASRRRTRGAESRQRR
jgi:hypothetical protein